MLLCIGVFFVTGCQKAIESTGEEMIQPNHSLFLQADNEKIEINMTNKEILQQFMGYLPQTLSLNELNGNEVYADLPFQLSVKPQNIDEIRAGDVMVYGNQTLVIFYKDHQTTYRYTKIGEIRELSKLDILINSQEAILENK